MHSEVQKYVQSDTLNTYKEVKQNLINKNEGFICRYPLRNCWLKKYLGVDYENLITTDFICHGVPSQKLFSKYIKWIENKEKI